MSTTPFTAAHRFHVKSLYRRLLKNSLDWTIRRDIWRQQALEIRSEFERNRNVTDPRAIADLLARGEAQLEATLHPDPYIPPSFPGGSKWERNLPPPIEPPVDYRHTH
ncbi:NDUFB9, NADH-ubiquinone oxidoreductase [Cantharellus anzutake]|uniref:NDUFB9, NADH-ubiquinone oxidoreductase n=1 Tax=Cantharellus anzutake TaxID=1750568 RepID=UPI0019034D6E|nr:NDUFB9, NADH-ubiquinone oxidoreductase [Cantharellus anzutake]KAF8338827.1 NDUFB9, NADH-ubiquinone oxidoreductase [Cantharellus anzutake]